MLMFCSFHAHDGELRKTGHLPNPFFYVKEQTLLNAVFRVKVDSSILQYPSNKETTYRYFVELHYYWLHLVILSFFRILHM